MTPDADFYREREELAAARRLVARHECATFGHDLGIVKNGAGAPVLVYCERGCGHAPWALIAGPACTDDCVFHIPTAHDHGCPRRDMERS